MATKDTHKDEDAAQLQERIATIESDIKIAKDVLRYVHSARQEVQDQKEIEGIENQLNALN